MSGIGGAIKITIKIKIKIKIRIVGVDGDAEALATEEEPEDAEFPVVETIYVGVGLVVEIVEGAGGDEVFAAAFAAGKQKRQIGDLLGQNVDGAIDPGDLGVGVVEERAAGFGVGAGEPGGGVWGNGALEWGSGGAGDV